MARHSRRATMRVPAVPAVPAAPVPASPLYTGKGIARILRRVTFTSHDPIRLLVLLDSDIPTPEGAAPDAPVLRETQIAVAGDFVSGRYGRFKITEADIDSMIAHYGRVYPLNPTELAIDYDHLSTPADPNKVRMPGDGRAAGWIKRLIKKATLLGGKPAIGLFAEVEYTPAAAKMIREKEYRFFSPTFVKEYATNLGQKLGATLLGGALTNHPFLHGMNAVQLSDELAIPYAGAPAGVPKMAKTITVKNAQGEDVVLNLDDVTSNADVKAALTPAPAPAPVPDPKQTGDPIALSADDVKTAITAGLAPLVATVTTLSSEIAAMKAEKAANAFDAKFTELLKAGKVVPAQRDLMKTLSDSNFDAWAKSMDAAPAVIKLNGAARPVGEDPLADDVVDNDGLQDAFDKAVEKYRTDNPALKLSYTEASAAVAKAQPDLAKQLQQSFRQ